jgi:hypothetical protein
VAVLGGDEGFEVVAGLAFGGAGDVFLVVAAGEWVGGLSCGVRCGGGVGSSSSGGSLVCGAGEVILWGSACGTSDCWVLGWRLKDDQIMCES